MGFYPRGRPGETSDDLVLQTTHYKSAKTTRGTIPERLDDDFEQLQKILCYKVKTLEHIHI